MDIGDKVKIVKKIDGEPFQIHSFSWVNEMDMYLGTCGKIVSVEDDYKQFSKIYEVELFDNDQFWFWEGALEEMNKDFVIWYISSYSKKPYKFIGKGKNYSYFEDADGNIFSSYHINFVNAPADCDSFDWKPKN